MNLGAVILAAGYSSRMGNFKPLLHLKKRSLLSHCINLFNSIAVEQLVVVIGHRGDELLQSFTKSYVKFVHNPRHADGMFSSVCVAIQALQSSGDVDGFFVLPVDIPLIRQVTLETLVSNFDGEQVLYPRFRNERGHPPLIPSALIPAIRDHDGEGGLQSLLERFPGRDIPVWDQSILMDADTPEDFTQLVEYATIMDIGSCGEVQVLAESSMPPRGVAHGQAVAKIGCRLGKALNSKGMNLDIQLIYNGGMLHDIAKGQQNHEARGAAILRSLGLGRVAEVVGSHRDVGEGVGGKLTEKELVCLADKLVRGTTPMSVQERFREKQMQYADDPEALKTINTRLKKILALQTLVEERTGRSVSNILED